MARGLPNYIKWNKGPSFGIILLPRPLGGALYTGLGHYGLKRYNTVVTNNGEEWDFFITNRSAVDITKNMFGLRNKEDDWHMGTYTKEVPNYRLAAEWAKKEIAKKKKKGTLVLDHVYSTPALQTVSRDSMVLWNDDAVTYDGFNLIQKRSAHTLKALHEAINRSTKLIKLKWNWVPVRPTVAFHSKTRAMGLAYNPGGGSHSISLHVKLLAEYNMKSIFRVLLHEWCHHFRDEKFQRSTDMHDRKFCDLLGLVDPIVIDNYKECASFTDIKDVAIASLNRKKVTKKSPVFTPQAGTMVLEHMKDGSYTIRWEPKDNYKWSSVRFKYDTIGSFEKFIKNFSLADFHEIPAVLASRNRLGNYERRLPDGVYTRTTYKDKEALMTTLWEMSAFLYQVFKSKELETIIMEADEYVD